MRSHTSIDRIADLLALFAREVSVRRKASLTDVNRVAQDIVCRLLRIILDLPDLRNLDATERANFPAVDLGDDARRVAVQVTSDGSGDKIKETLDTFARYGLEDRFDRLKFFVLTRRQGRYGNGLIASVPSGLAFDPDKDVLDPDRLLPLIAALEPASQRHALELLEEEFGEGGLHWAEIPYETLERHGGTFVPPKQFDAALAALSERKLLILTGPPHVGKSSTALGLMSAICGEASGRRILALSVEQALKRVGSLENELIVLDDAFGEVELKNADGANAVGSLERLALSNCVVVTSRKAVLEEARRKTKLGESVSLRISVVELNQEGSYDSAALALVLDRHLTYQSSEACPLEIRIPVEKANEIRRFAAYIVSELRFPHNVERFVSAWNTVPFEGRYVDVLIARSKDIELAARRWYEGLSDPLRLTVCLCALFPNPSPEERSGILTDLGIASVNERVLARDSGGYLGYNRSLQMAHPSYREGVLRALKSEYLDDASRVLRTAAPRLERLDFESVSRVKLAYGLLATGHWRHEAFLPDEEISPRDYYLRYVRAYNGIVERDFPKLRHVFKPHCVGQARIHLYLTSKADVVGWSFIARRPDGPELTESEEQPGFGAHRTSVERGQLEIDPHLPLSWRTGSQHRTTIPEVEAFDGLIKQLKRQLESSAGVHVGATLRTADLLQDLEYAGFPVDEISAVRPLTPEWLQEWARPFLEFHSTGVWPTDREGRMLRFTLRYDPPRINDLDVDWAIGFVASMAEEGRVIDGPLLVGRDLPRDRPIRRFPVANRSDWYSDEALVRAVENGLRKHRQAVREILADAFPTLYRRMSNLWTQPISVVCVVDREIEDYMRRPSISLGYRQERAVGQPEDFQLKMHFISSESSPADAEKLRKLQDSLWSDEAEFLTAGFDSFSSLVELKEWRRSVQSEVRRALESFLESEEHRVFRAG